MSYTVEHINGSSKKLVFVYDNVDFADEITVELKKKQAVSNIKGLLGANHNFTNLDDVLLAYNQDQIELHTLIWVRYNDQLIEPVNFIKTVQLKDGSYIECYENMQIRKDQNGNQIVQYLQTTTGRVIFNHTVQRTLNLLS